MGVRAVAVLLNFAFLGLAVSGCKRSDEPKPAGSDLPVTSDRSVALPDATNAADAPHAPQVVESRSAEFTTYRDPLSGVSFNYPTDWRPAVAGQSPVAPRFEQTAGKTRITQEFLPENTRYAPTVLRALLFSYTVKKAIPAGTCAALAQKVIPGSPVQQVHSGDRVFFETATADGAACTQVQTRVDTTSQGHQCFVFERDLVTGCPYSRSATDPRPLTGAESLVLQAQLDAVLQSVRISAK